MAPERRQGMAAVLRHRVLHGLESGALREGDRLPSTRELATDLRADQRVVAAAYRLLADEGLVVLRPRSGVFVASLPASANARTPGPSRAWLAEVIADGVRHGVPVPQVADALAAVTRTRTLSAAVIASTLDQAVGIARELRDDFGLDAHAYLADQLRSGEALPRAVQRAHLLVGTELTAQKVARLATRLDRPHLVIDARTDLLGSEWRLLLKRVAYVVIADPRFAPLIHALLSDADGAHNIRVLVAGRDDLSVIPAEAPTYVTEAARQRAGRSRLPGRLVATARVLGDATTRALAEFIVAQHQVAAAPKTRRRR